MSSLLNVFKAYVEVQETWPEEIAHLKGKKLFRKKDNGQYIIRHPSGQCIGGKPAAYLEPAGCDWEARSHWKTYAKILKDFTVKS